MHPESPLAALDASYIVSLIAVALNRAQMTTTCSQVATLTQLRDAKRTLKARGATEHYAQWLHRRIVAEGGEEGATSSSWIAARLAAQKSHPLDEVEGGVDLDVLDKDAVLSDAKTYERHVKGLRAMAAACVHAPVARREYLSARLTALARVRDHVHGSTQTWSTAVVVSHRENRVQAASRASMEARAQQYDPSHGAAASGPFGILYQPAAHSLATRSPGGPTASTKQVAGGVAVPLGTVATRACGGDQLTPAPLPPPPLGAGRALYERATASDSGAGDSAALTETPPSSAPPEPAPAVPVPTPLSPAPSDAPLAAHVPSATAGGDSGAPAVATADPDMAGSPAPPRSRGPAIPMGAANLAPAATPSGSAPRTPGVRGQARPSFFTPGKRALPMPSSAPRSTPSRKHLASMEKIKAALKRGRAQQAAADAKKRVHRITVRVCSDLCALFSMYS